MPDGETILGSIILLLVLILINGFFSMSEIAVITLNDAKLKKDALSGNKTSKILFRLIEEPGKFLATIQVGVTLSGFLSSAFAADSFSEYFVYWFKDTSIPADTVRAVSLVVITLLLSYATLVFGELVPKRLAMKNPEAISKMAAQPLKYISIVSTPFIWLLTHSTNGVLRLIGIDPNDKDREVTEEEIRLMIDEGEQDGTIAPAEQEMIHNIFEFNNLSVNDVMTHRTEVEWISIDTSLEEIVNLTNETGHSRIPVCGEDGIDEIKGIVVAKDLLKYIFKSKREFKIDDCIRDVIFVPETAPCNEVFEQLRVKRSQIAVVVDEYGGTAGIVTVEDLIESIVGNIQDEFDDEPEEIQKVAEDKYIIAGTADLEEVEDDLEIVFSNVGDYETIAGLLTDRLRRIPEEGERPSIEESGYTFTVLEVDDHRISKVLAKKSDNGKSEKKSEE